MSRLTNGVSCCSSDVSFCDIASVEETIIVIILCPHMKHGCRVGQFLVLFSCHEI